MTELLRKFRLTISCRWAEKNFVRRNLLKTFSFAYFFGPTDPLLAGVALSLKMSGIYQSVKLQKIPRIDPLFKDHTYFGKSNSLI